MAARCTNKAYLIRRTLRDTLRAVFEWWTGSRERSRQRRALGRLDERLLRDIGVTRHQASRESGKPFWRR